MIDIDVTYPAWFRHDAHVILNLVLQKQLDDIPENTQHLSGIQPLSV